MGQVEFDLNALVRPSILKLKPYSSARDEFSGSASVFLDANENPYNNGYNRYPDPLQRSLKEKIAQLKRLEAENIFLGNGSDEAIDLLFRIFCEPGVDNVIIHNPTYGMYEVCAGIQNTEVRKVSLTENHELDDEAMLQAANAHSKLMFICSPNNPTGNSFDIRKITRILNEFKGIVVLDEAYIDFAVHDGLRSYLKNYPNLVLLHTFSKAWGLAGIRLGMAFAHKEIIQLYNKVKYPYNVNLLTQQMVHERIDTVLDKESMVMKILEQREKLREAISSLPFVQKVFHSDANFLLVKMQNARKIYDYLMTNQVIVRDRSKVHLCTDSLRITIGTEEENNQIVTLLKAYMQ